MTLIRNFLPRMNTDHTDFRLAFPDQCLGPAIILARLGLNLPLIKYTYK